LATGAERAQKGRTVAKRNALTIFATSRKWWDHLREITKMMHHLADVRKMVYVNHFVEVNKMRA